MIKKISLIIISTCITLIFVSVKMNVSANENSNLFEDNLLGESYYYGSSNFFPEIEKEIVSHSSSITIEYSLLLFGEATLDHFSYDDDSGLVLTGTKTNSNYYTIEAKCQNPGEYSFTVIAHLKSSSAQKLYSKMYIYATESYDYYSVSSIDDAKYSCYLHITNSENPSYEEYEAFFNDATYSDEMFSTIGISLDGIGVVPLRHSMRFYGTLRWKDFLGQNQLLKDVKVEITYNPTGLVDDMITLVMYTNTNGQFDKTIQYSGTGLDITYKIFAENGKVKVLNNSASPIVYSNYQSYSNYSYVNDSLDCSYTFGNLTDRDKAFGVLQGIDMAAEYVYTSGGYYLDQISVKYPVGGTNADSYGAGVISLSSERSSIWDCSQHEYGHYVQEKNGMFTSGGGAHYPSMCLMTYHGKIKGAKLAWEEGWAHYFAISVQQAMNASTLGIRGVGDFAITDELNSNSTLDLKINMEDVDRTINRLYGEGDELSICATLLDFADPKNDDNVELTYSYLYNTTTLGQYKTFSDFMNTLLLVSSQETIRDFAEILSRHSISPSLSSYIQPQTDNSSVLVLQWIKGGGSSNQEKNYGNNSFSVLFFNSSMQFICESITIEENINLPGTLKLSPQIIYLIKNSQGDFFYCTVRAYQKTTYTSGPYTSNYLKIPKTSLGG